MSQQGRYGRVALAPRYPHGCAECLFVGHWERYDLYRCDADVIVARYGPEIGDYLAAPDLILGELRVASARQRYFTADRDIQEMQRAQ